MKITIHTSSSKEIKYRIYALQGRERTLLNKGRFENQTEINLSNTSSQIIVRTSAYSLWQRFWAFLYVSFWLCFHTSPITMEYHHTKYVKELNYFNEIRIDCKKNDELIVIKHALTPLIINKRNRALLADTLKGELVALTSTTHSYIEETAYKDRLSRWERRAGYLISIFLIVIILFAGVLLLTNML